MVAVVGAVGLLVVDAFVGEGEQDGFAGVGPGPLMRHHLIAFLKDEAVEEHRVGSAVAEMVVQDVVCGQYGIAHIVALHERYVEVVAVEDGTQLGHLITDGVKGCLRQAGIDECQQLDAALLDVFGFGVAGRDELGQRVPALLDAFYALADNDAHPAGVEEAVGADILRHSCGDGESLVIRRKDDFADLSRLFLLGREVAEEIDVIGVYEFCHKRVAARQCDEGCEQAEDA